MIKIFFKKSIDIPLSYMQLRLQHSLRYISSMVKNIKKGGYNMAMPIAPTPILKGRTARKFDKIIEEGLKSPVGIISTPHLEKARLLVKEYANKHKK